MMKYIVLVLTLVAFTLCVKVDLSAPALDAQMIEELNKDKEMTWKAGHNAFFDGKTIADVKKMLISRDYFAKDANDAIATLQHPATDLPKDFDSRKQWPNCIHSIRNQAQCGSCWAFAASEVLSDRTCIKGQDVGVLSPQYLVSCDTTDYGCQGGYLTNSWQFLQSTGVRFTFPN